MNSSRDTSMTGKSGQSAESREIKTLWKRVYRRQLGEPMWILPRRKDQNRLCDGIEVRGQRSSFIPRGKALLPFQGGLRISPKEKKKQRLPSEKDRENVTSLSFIRIRHLVGSPGFNYPKQGSWRRRTDGIFDCWRRLSVLANAHGELKMCKLNET